VRLSAEPIFIIGNHLIDGGNEAVETTKIDSHKNGQQQEGMNG